MSDATEDLITDLRDEAEYARLVEAMAPRAALINRAADEIDTLRSEIRSLEADREMLRTRLHEATK